MKFLLSVAALVTCLAAGPLRVIRAHGANQPATPDTWVHPFRIQVPDTVLADLRARLKSPRLPALLQGAGWELGTDTA